ncbi:hypothetical protein ACFU7Y_38465 [Kitasatospora sp. NPDC057542]|uniref:hypothetical protein n=1 Tax=Kitasatospora sp. NPDC057542 TaxID=3346162 RepID=UPI003677F747
MVVALDPLGPVPDREAVVARLMDLDSRGELTTAHVRLVASSLGVTMWAVWYWIAAARKEGRFSPRPRPQLTITPEIRRLLAFWGGNVSAVHRELVARAADDPDTGPVLSLSALHRAVVRDLSVGERVGLRGGEAARRAYDVFPQPRAPGRRAPPGARRRQHRRDWSRYFRQTSSPSPSHKHAPHAAHNSQLSSQRRGG